MNKFDLSKRVGLITGGSGLLGLEHSIALLDSGASVVITDINKNTLLDTYNRLRRRYDRERVFYKVLDVTNEQNIDEVFSELQKEGLYIDILINNAAIDPKVKSTGLLEESRLENFSTDTWEFEVKVGLTGAILCSKTFGHGMASNNGGVILNIASDLSVFAPDQRIYRKEGLDPDLQPVKPVSYSVIKHGLIGLTKYLATYWADRGVRCNALSPGGVYNGQDDDFVQKLTELIPLGRMANRSEYHGAIQFLCSDASEYMNGQNIIIDGGYTSI